MVFCARCLNEISGYRNVIRGQVDFTHILKGISHHRVYEYCSIIFTSRKMPLSGFSYRTDEERM